MSPAVLRFLAERYEQIEVRYDPAQRALWAYQRPRPRPCFNLELLSEIKRLQEAIQRACHGHDEVTSPVRYLIIGSRTPGAFSLGGDLGLMLELIRNRDRQGLRRYALACVEVLYLNSVNLNAPLTSVALVQGAALGGGFEAAISCSVVIAERQVQMGLPEILFNLFPGMGAYSFLARRIHPIHAERLILSGEMWLARELYEKGIVDVVAEAAAGQQAVVDYLRRQERVGIGTFGLLKARNRVQPVAYQELFDVAMIWADSALHLSERDLRVMERLLRAQNRAYDLAPSLRDSANVVPLIS